MLRASQTDGPCSEALVMKDLLGDPFCNRIANTRSGDMGQAKNESIRHDRLVGKALGIAIEAGSVSVECPHETPIDLLNPEPAYELAREKFARGELPDFGSLQDVTDALDEAFLETGEECGACAKNAHD